MGLISTTLAGVAVVLIKTIQPRIVFAAPKHKDHRLCLSYRHISYDIAEDEQSDTLIIYSHGNAEDLCTIDFHEMKKELKCSVLAYDYPGYGMSLGQPSEQSCVVALETIVNLAKSLWPNKKIILVGRSLGTGVVVQYAYKSGWTFPIVLLSPFKSIGRVVSDNVLSHELSGMFKTINVIEELKCPVKIIHGINDTIVPQEHGQFLYEKSKNRLKPEWKLCGHNDLPLLRCDLEDVLNK